MYGNCPWCRSDDILMAFDGGSRICKNTACRGSRAHFHECVPANKLAEQAPDGKWYYFGASPLTCKFHGPGAEKAEHGSDVSKCPWCKQMAAYLANDGGAMVPPRCFTKGCPGSSGFHLCTNRNTEAKKAPDGRYYMLGVGHHNCAFAPKVHNGGNGECPWCHERIRVFANDGGTQCCQTKGCPGKGGFHLCVPQNPKTKQAPNGDWYHMGYGLLDCKFAPKPDIAPGSFMSTMAQVVQRQQVQPGNHFKPERDAFDGSPFL